MPDVPWSLQLLSPVTALRHQGHSNRHRLCYGSLQRAPCLLSLGCAGGALIAYFLLSSPAHSLLRCPGATPRARLLASTPLEALLTIFLGTAGSLHIQAAPSTTSVSPACQQNEKHQDCAAGNNRLCSDMQSLWPPASTKLIRTPSWCGVRVHVMAAITPSNCPNVRPAPVRCCTTQSESLLASLTTFDSSNELMA